MKKYIPHYVAIGVGCSVLGLGAGMYSTNSPVIPLFFLMSGYALGSARTIYNLTKPKQGDQQ